MMQPLKTLSPVGAAYHLEQLYQEVEQTRMLDIPILNHVLKVQAVGFREWHEYVIGVLITPWFMNLMLLPTHATDWSGLKVGSKRDYTFEAGSFEFIMGEEENLGRYMSCSMFSPMFEFTSHEAAVETAEAIVAGMFNVDNKEELVGENMSPMNEPVMEADNEAGLTESVLEGVQTLGAIAKENLEKPLSRRDLLRGGLFRKKENQQQENGEESDQRV